MHTKIIIYDDTCPLCAAYTNAFVHTGLIAKKNRANFNTIPPELLSKIDLTRCSNEIPLIDTQTNQVWYGIDALLEILNQKIPFTKTVGNVRPVKWFLYKLYKFISFNRRVIVATGTKSGGFDCTPDFNMRYRIAFMAFFLIFNTAMLYPLGKYVLSESIFNKGHVMHIVLAHIILVSINIFISLQIRRKAGIEYLGQINMLALICTLLTIPLIIANKYLVACSSSINNIYLLSVALFISKDYVRRMKFANIIASYPWIVVINILCVAALLLYLIF